MPRDDSGSGEEWKFLRRMEIRERHNSVLHQNCYNSTPVVRVEKWSAVRETSGSTKCRKNVAKSYNVSLGTIAGNTVEIVLPKWRNWQTR